MRFEGLLAERLTGEFGLPSVLFDSDAVIFNIGVVPTEILHERLCALMWREPQADGGGVNFVRLGEGHLRSGSAAPLSLHQEGYELADPPEYLFLYCVEFEGFAGETTVASCRPLLADVIRESLKHAMVRFYRTSVQAWTPWRLILENGEQGSRVRFAFPDAHRQVEVRGTDLSVERIAQLIEATTREVAWRPGLLLAVNNWSILHGRRTISAGVRTLWRLVC